MSDTSDLCARPGCELPSGAAVHDFDTGDGTSFHNFVPSPTAPEEPTPPNLWCDSCSFACCSTTWKLGDPCPECSGFLGLASVASSPARPLRADAQALFDSMRSDMAPAREPAPPMCGECDKPLVDGVCLTPSCYNVNSRPHDVVAARREAPVATDEWPECLRGLSREREGMAAATGPILVEVASERRRQDAKWGGAAHDDAYSAQEWRDFRLCFEQRVSLSALESPRDGDDLAVARHNLVRIAALAVAQIESIDRQSKVRHA